FRSPMVVSPQSVSCNWCVPPYVGGAWASSSKESDHQKRRRRRTTVEVTRRLRMSGDLLPLDGSRWLRGHVEHNAVNVGDLIGDAGGDTLQDLIRQAGPVGGHGILGGHRTQHDRVTVGAAVTLDTDRADIREQDHRALPDDAVQT